MNIDIQEFIEMFGSWCMAQPKPNDIPLQAHHKSELVETENKLQRCSGTSRKKPPITLR